MIVRHCELCKSEAAVFCSADDAFLCWTCDSQVHEANFLVARHVRQFVCSICNNLTGPLFPGVGFKPFRPTCSSCPSISAADDLDSLSDSSVCISSTKECCGGSQGFDSSSSSDSSSAAAAYAKRRRRRESKSRVDIFKAEGIFVNWCAKLGVHADEPVRLACRPLKTVLNRWTVLPFRIFLAASMWHGLRLSGQTAQVLKRLEEISGVPAKIIVAAEFRLDRGGRKMQQRRRLELEEGWAEC